MATGLVVVATVTVVLADLATVGWVGWFPRWRPALRSGETCGVDVSAHQGPIDWPAARSDHIRFAYIKSTEGQDFVDAEFASNRRGARLAGIRVGAYHFFTLCKPGSAQAKNFVAVGSPASGDLPPAVDLELGGNCNARSSPAIVRAELSDFVRVVTEAWGSPPVVYEGGDFAARYPDIGIDALPAWRHRFVRRPPQRWALWQVSGFARVHEIHGRVDLDVSAATSQ